METDNVPEQNQTANTPQSSPTPPSTPAASPLTNETPVVTSPVASDSTAGSATVTPSFGEPSVGMGTSATVSAAPVEEPWWQSERYVEPHRGHHRHSKSTGVVLVALGVLLLAANAGVFRWIDGRTMWPLILIGIGVILLGRQSGWWSR